MNRLCTIVAALLALQALPGDRAAAQGAWPDRPLRIVVSFAAGGGHDLIARALAAQLAEPLGQQVLVENRPGAAGNISAEHVAKSRPDGTTFLWGTSATLIFNVSLYKSLPYDPVKDLMPVSLVSELPLVMLVNKDLPAANLRELIALYKASPGKYSYGSAGAGTALHLGAELFKARAGIDVVHVPYRGAAPALADLLKGEVSMIFDAVTVNIKNVQAGTVRAVAVPAAKRTQFLPDVPTFAEAGLAGVEIGAWNGVFAPNGTPAAVIERLHGEINKALADPRFVARLADLGAHPITGTTPAGLARYIASEITAWRPIIAATGAKAE